MDRQARNINWEDPRESDFARNMINSAFRILLYRGSGGSARLRNHPIPIGIGRRGVEYVIYPDKYPTAEALAKAVEAYQKKVLQAYGKPEYLLVYKDRVWKQLEKMKKEVENEKGLDDLLSRMKWGSEDSLHAKAVKLAHETPALRKHLVPLLREAADKWIGVALDELAEEMDVDRRYLKVVRGFRIKNGFQVESKRGRGSNGESEWMVFKSWKDAEKYAFEYVKEQLEDEPGIFNQKWLSNYLTVPDADQIGQEEADSYVGDLDVNRDREDILRLADLESEYEEFDDEESELEEEYDAGDIDPDEYEKKLSKIEDKREKFVEDAKDTAIENYAEEVASRINDDPLGWLDDMGYDLDRGLPSFAKIDTDKAAKAALRADGVDHFLDHYDGDHFELDSGAVCFGTN